MVQKTSETRDLAKRSGRVVLFCFFFYHLIQPWGAMTHTVRDSASTFVLELCGSGVTELLTAASAEGCV